MNVEVAGASLAAGGRLIVDGVDCTFPPGRLSGLLGPNGAGKSTLLRLVAGVAEPDGGAVLLDGAPVHALPRRERARRVALLEQDAAAGVPLRVLDVVLLGRIPHHPGWGAADGPDDRRIALDALAEVDAAGLADRAWETLSGGERQRVHIARALAQRPRLLLLDEPTNHLDVAAQLHLLGFVRRRGLTTVAALHDLNLAAAYCAHLVVLSAGRVVAAGAPADVLTAGLIEDVYGAPCRVVPHPRTGRPLIAFDPED